MGGRTGRLRAAGSHCSLYSHCPFLPSVYIFCIPLSLGTTISIMATAGIKSSYSDLWSCLRAYTQTRVAAVILLSFVLAVGFLLVILSCALWANWLPLLVGA